MERHVASAIRHFGYQRFGVDMKLNSGWTRVIERSARLGLWLAFFGAAGLAQAYPGELDTSFGCASGSCTGSPFSSTTGTQIVFSGLLGSAIS